MVQYAGNFYFILFAQRTRCLLNHATGLTHTMLSRMPLFSQVVDRLNRWFVSMTVDHSAGVLVSHNTDTDVQFLLVEYTRVGKRLPSSCQNKTVSGHVQDVDQVFVSHLSQGSSGRVEECV